MEEKRRLYIPVQIRREKQMVEGFGKKEISWLLGFTGLCTGIVIGLVMVGILPALWIILIAVISAGVGGILLRKNNQDFNIVDIVQYMLEFSRSQKRYFYEYRNPYEKDGNRKAQEK